jgi:predicted XRE-type DNA-binding protein
MKGQDAARLAAFLEDEQQRRRFDESAMIDQIVTALQDAIERAEISRYEIARRTGITQSLLSRLMSGDRPNVTIETLAKLAVELGLTVRIEPAKRHRK